LLHKKKGNDIRLFSYQNQSPFLSTKGYIIHLREANFVKKPANTPKKIQAIFSK
jgi:hypothetical protein